MQEEKGVQKYLFIDLNEQKWIEKEISLKPGVGGEALAYHLYAQHQTEEPLCFALGFLSGSPLPCASTLSLVGRSIANNRVEGETVTSIFSSSLATLPWRGIVLAGSGRRLMSLHIGSGGVSFEATERYLGMTISQINQNLEGDAILAIGPAGEKGVTFASIFERDRPIERWGFGALMGSKGVKALVVEGSGEERIPADPEKFAKAIKKFEKITARSPFLATLCSEGDLPIIERGMKRGFCGVNNISRRTDPRLFHLGSSEMTRRYAPKVDHLDGCPFACNLKIGNRRLPSYLEVLALGSNLGNYDSEVVLDWVEEATEQGLNPISTGVVIGWMMAARLESPSEESFNVKFGKTRGVKELIRAIGEGRRGGEEVGKGIAYLEENYLKPSQREKISSHIGGREMLPIDPRGAWMGGLFMALGYDTSPVGEILLQYLSPCSLFSKAEWTVVEENLMATFNSVGLGKNLMAPLLFERSRFPFKQLFLRRPLTAYHWVSTKLVRCLLGSYRGEKVGVKELINIGREAISMREELNGGELPPLPQRFTLDASSQHPKESVFPYRKLVERYQFLRALDLARYRRS